MIRKEIRRAYNNRYEVNELSQVLWTALSILVGYMSYWVIDMATSTTP